VTNKGLKMGFKHSLYPLIALFRGGLEIPLKHHCVAYLLDINLQNQFMFFIQHFFDSKNLLHSQLKCIEIGILSRHLMVGVPRTKRSNIRSIFQLHSWNFENKLRAFGCAQFWTCAQQWAQVLWGDFLFCFLCFQHKQQNKKNWQCFNWYSFERSDSDQGSLNDTVDDEIDNDLDKTIVGEGKNNLWNQKYNIQIIFDLWITAIFGLCFVMNTADEDLVQNLPPKSTCDS
jgi:hypothetical protein